MYHICDITMMKIHIMNKETFLQEVEKYRSIAKGNYREISRLAGVDHQELTYAMAGRNNKEEFLSKIFLAIKTHCTKAIDNVLDNTNQRRVNNPL